MAFDSAFEASASCSLLMLKNCRTTGVKYLDVEKGCCGDWVSPFRSGIQVEVDILEAGQIAVATGSGIM